MAEPSTSDIVLIVGISVTSALVIFLALIITLLVIRWRKHKKGRDLDNRFIAIKEHNLPVYTVNMNRSTSGPVPPPVYIKQHPVRATSTRYADSRISTVSQRTSSHYATVSGLPADHEDYPYTVVNKSAVSRTARDSNVDSMRSSVGLDLGGQYEKAQWILRD